MHDKTVSVIVPVYNVAPYLEQCLQSIAEQSFKDWECILVDDGSTDGSSHICDIWAVKDQRFKVVHQTNKGVSAARNEGIKVSHGEYIVFIDSDDWVDADYLSDLLAGADENVDLVVTGVNQRYVNRTQRNASEKKLTIQLIPNFTDDFICNIGLHYGPMAKLFRTSIIKTNQVEFPLDCSLGEDLAFNFGYLRQIKTIHYLPLVNYNYRMRESGSLITTHRDNIFDIHYHQWHLQKSFLVEKGMWNKSAEDYLYNQMWAIVYEGIFTATTPNLKLYKRILGVEETKCLKHVSNTFNTSKWIKCMILKRQYLLLFLYLKFKKRKCCK